MAADSLWRRLLVSPIAERLSRAATSPSRWRSHSRHEQDLLRHRSTSRTAYDQDCETAWPNLSLRLLRCFRWGNDIDIRRRLADLLGRGIECHRLGASLSYRGNRSGSATGYTTSVEYPRNRRSQPRWADCRMNNIHFERFPPEQKVKRVRGVRIGGGASNKEIRSHRFLRSKSRRIVAHFGSDGTMNAQSALSLGNGIFLNLGRTSCRWIGQTPGISGFRREVLVRAGKSLSALPSINPPFA